MADLEEILKKLTTTKGVEGVIILNQDGIPIRSTLTDNEKTVAYAGVFSILAMKGKSMLREMMEGEELHMIRLRSSKNEIILTPEGNYLIIVIQKPDAS